jgi:hypothetical protein
MNGNMDLTVVAGARDNDVAARIVDEKGSSGGERLSEGLVALVFVAHELVPVVLIDVPPLKEPGVAAVSNTAEDDSGDGEEDEKSEDASAYTPAVSGLGGVRLRVLVICPLEEHDDSGTDEEEGPEATVPVPEAVSLKATGLNQQEDDTECDQDERTEDGTAAHCPCLIAVGVTLRAQHIALGSRLILQDLALILPVVPIGRTGRWVGRRIV